LIITFLGTGTSQGVPVIACKCEVCRSLDFRDKRFRTSIHIAVEGKSFIIDTGPEFRQQVLREGIDTLDALIFTHEHKDHTAGLDDVRAFNYVQQKEMPLYARQQVINQIRIEFAYAFADFKYPGAPQLKINSIENKPFTVEGIEIIPINVFHYRLPVFGYRIQDFTYITDANRIDEEEKEKIKGTKVLVLNALQKSAHISHFTLEEAIELIQELGPEKAYLTHISHRMGTQKEVSKLLPSNIELAYDGLKINI
jgi:phosphoribosyl 1,2-cyclic phosphate phosphodiesterase